MKKNEFFFREPNNKDFYSFLRIHDHHVTLENRYCGESYDTMKKLRIALIAKHVRGVCVENTVTLLWDV